MVERALTPATPTVAVRPLGDAQVHRRDAYVHVMTEDGRLALELPVTAAEVDRLCGDALECRRLLKAPPPGEAGPDLQNVSVEGETEGWPVCTLTVLLEDGLLVRTTLSEGEARHAGARLTGMSQRAEEWRARGPWALPGPNLMRLAGVLSGLLLFASGFAAGVFYMLALGVP